MVVDLERPVSRIAYLEVFLKIYDIDAIRGYESHKKISLMISQERSHAVIVHLSTQLTIGNIICLFFPAQLVHYFQNRFVA